jgi:hypothetical protein
MEIQNELETDNIIDILRQRQQEQPLPLSIDVLDLSTRVRHALYRERMNTIQDLVKNWGKIPRIRNLGPKGLSEITEKLDLWFQSGGILSLPSAPALIPAKQVISNQKSNDQTINDHLSWQDESFSNIPVEMLDLPISIYKLLKRRKLNTIGKIYLEWQNISTFRNIGPTKLEIIQKALYSLPGQIRKESASNDESGLGKIQGDLTSSPLSISQHIKQRIKVSIRILDLAERTQTLLIKKNIHTIDQITSGVLEEFRSAKVLKPWTIRQIKSAILLWLAQDESRKNTYFEVMQDTGIITPPQKMSNTEYINFVFGAVKPRARDIIEFRYGLKTGNKTTLQEAADHFGITRERIRQIEYQGISSLKSQLTTTGPSPLFEKMKECIDNHGGLISKPRLMDELGTSFLNTGFTIEGIIELVTKIFDGDISQGQNDLKIKYLSSLDGWTTNSYDLALIELAENRILEILSASPSPIQFTELYLTLVCTDGLLTLDENLAHSVVLCMSDTQHIHRQLDGSWCIYRKEHRNDRILSVLRQIGQPAHFTEIAERYNQMYLDRPRSAHNVHAVLGHGEEFVRIGRGKYGLAEWGMHDDGNVANAVRRVLAARQGPMLLADIVDEVLKTWDVQKSAVIAAIDNDARFSKTEDGNIWLTETGINIKKRIKYDDVTRADRLLLVLREVGKPLPIRVLVKTHNNSYPDRPITVSGAKQLIYHHTELFVRSGPDEFGLVEWDLEPYLDVPIDRSGEVRKILQEKSPLSINELSNLYNQYYPEKKVGLNTIRGVLKKLNGAITSPRRGFYELVDHHHDHENEKTSLHPQHDDRFGKILKIFTELHRPSQVTSILDRYNQLNPEDQMSLEGFMEYLKYVKKHPEKYPTGFAQ